MQVHLIPTEEQFAEYVRETYGADAVLHPANRRTRCGKPMDLARDTVFPRRVTCKSCARKAGASC